MSLTTPGSLRPRWGADGLVPIVVQDVADGRVLMVAYADAEALAATLATGELHFHSRSRGRLWRKGETSGNTLRLVDLALDCDADAILASVVPAGPSCHRATRSCFDAQGSTAGPGPDSVPSPAPQGFGWLEELWATIDERTRLRPAGSYTAALVAGGVDAVARKVTEEATEVLLAAKDDAATEAGDGDRSGTSANVAAEAADLLYHLLVLIAERGVPPRAIIEVLVTRRAG